MYICVYTIYIYIYRERERQRDTSYARGGRGSEMRRRFPQQSTPIAIYRNAWKRTDADELLGEINVRWYMKEWSRTMN